MVRSRSVLVWYTRLAKRGKQGEFESQPTPLFNLRDEMSGLPNWLYQLSEIHSLLLKLRLSSVEPSFTNIVKNATPREAAMCRQVLANGKPLMSVEYHANEKGEIDFNAE